MPEQKFNSSEKKLSLIDSPITNEQILSIFQRTPKKHVYERPAKGGGKWKYVTGVYVKKVLNYVFGFLWSFEVKEIEEKYGQIIVLGRLTVLNPKTLQPMVWKEQVGRSDIKMKKDGSGPLDYGNDKKAAVTDSLKKCASEYGVANDIYGSMEFRDIKFEGENINELNKEKIFKDTVELIKKASKENQEQIIKNAVNSGQFTKEQNDIINLITSL